MQLATHTVITINLNSKASQKTRNDWNIHGPQFRVPMEDHFLIEDRRRMLPVCSVKDDWMGLFPYDEISF